MRKARDFQTSLSYSWLELDHAKELQALAGLIDQHPKIAELVLQDLTHDGCQATGAQGASADFIFRALLLKQMHSWSYEELHFHLNDSQTSRTFCQIPLTAKAPARSDDRGGDQKNSSRDSRSDQSHFGLRCCTAQDRNRQAHTCGLHCGRNVDARAHRLATAVGLYPGTDPADEEGSRLATGRIFHVFQPKKSVPRDAAAKSPRPAARRRVWRPIGIW